MTLASAGSVRWTPPARTTTQARSHSTDDVSILASSVWPERLSAKQSASAACAHFATIVGPTLTSSLRSRRILPSDIAVLRLPPPVMLSTTGRFRCPNRSRNANGRLKCPIRWRLRPRSTRCNWRRRLPPRHARHRRSSRLAARQRRQPEAAPHLVHARKWHIEPQ